MLLADKWKDYELIDMGNGEKLERWGEYILRRPDPQIIWPSYAKQDIWDSAHAVYHRSNAGGGSWDFKKRIPQHWKIRYGDIKFIIEPTGFKHTGLFPEQAVNWDWMSKKIKDEKIKRDGKDINILNLFAYTGGATVACTAAGGKVCHVDAAKGMVQRAKENIAVSGLADNPARFLTDDCMKFIKREQRRGNKYDAVIMDPPSYGRGPQGEIWKMEDSLFEFLEETVKLLSDNPLFILVNSYTTGFSATVIENMLSLIMFKKYKGTVSSGEVGLKASESGLILPCGIYGRWERK